MCRQAVLARVVRDAGAGRARIVILVLDGAGWQTAPLAVPEGIGLVFPQPCTRQLQPAATLRLHVDEPIVNGHDDSLGQLDALAADRQLIRGKAGVHGWPDRGAAT